MSEIYYNTIIWDKRKQKFNWYGLLLAKIKLNNTRKLIGGHCNIILYLT